MALTKKQVKAKLAKQEKRELDIHGEELYTISGEANQFDERQAVTNVLVKHIKSVSDVELNEDEQQEIYELTEKVEKPAFKALKLEEYRAMGKWKRRSYRKTAKEYLKQQAEAIRSRAAYKRIHRAAFYMNNEATKDDYQQDISADPIEMDKALIAGPKQTTDSFNSSQLTHLIKPQSLMETNFRYYCQYGDVATEINNYFRSDKKKEIEVPHLGEEPEKVAEDMEKVMKKASLKYPMVVRRGVGSKSVLKHMLGTNDSAAGDLSEDAIKEHIKKKLDNKENIILTEKGFCSTAENHKSGYPAGSEKDDGIEFVILLPKKTRALAVKNISVHSGEREILLAPGTKFRVVKAFFNDGEDKVLSGENPQVYMGEEGSWKIYLEALPANDSEGQLKTNKVNADKKKSA